MMMKNLSLKIAVLLVLLTGFITWRSDAMAATAPSLGNASSFAVLAGTSVSNTGATTVNGDLGVSPGSTITNVGTLTVSGTTHQADTAAANAQADTVTAYNALTAQSCDVGPLGVTDLAGATLVPGVYCYSSTLSNSGVLTLDAQGNGNAVWVFKMGSTLTTISGSTIVLINGGHSSNVFWQVGSSATLGTYTTLAGNILALTSITLNTGAVVDGSILAINGTVTLDSNSVLLSTIITVYKSVAVYSDPTNGTSNPKAIPGAVMLYTITLTNSGYGGADNNTTVVTDPVPANMKMCVSTLCNSPPVGFSCSATPSCGLTYTYATDVAYSNQVGGGAPYDYVVIPDAAGFDPNVTGVQISLAGAFKGASGGNNASFNLTSKMKVK